MWPFHTPKPGSLPAGSGSRTRSTVPVTERDHQFVHSVRCVHRSCGSTRSTTRPSAGRYAERSPQLRPCGPNVPAGEPHSHRRWPAPRAFAQVTRHQSRTMSPRASYQRSGRDRDRQQVRSADLSGTGGPSGTSPAMCARCLHRARPALLDRAAAREAARQRRARTSPRRGQRLNRP